MAIIMVMTKNDDIAISCGKSKNYAHSDNDVDNAFDEEGFGELF
jgi:hypothetical protein